MKRISFFLLLILLSCASKKEVGYAHLLKVKEVKPRQIDDLPIEFVLFRETDTVCKLYYKIDPKDFLSMRDSLGNWSRKANVELVLQNNQLGGLKLVEMAQDSLITSTQFIFDSCVFSLPTQRDVYLELKLIDEYKHVYQLYPLWWERDADFIAQDLCLWNQDSSQMETNSFVNVGRLIVRKHADLTSTLKIDVYQNIFQAAAPMFEIQDIRNTVISPAFDFHGNADEITVYINALKVDSYCRIYPLDEMKNGNKNQKFSFTKKIMQTSYLIAPICYLLDEKTENPAAIGLNTWLQFWSKASNNDPQVAERLIKEFNRRVKFANDKFGSYKEGWQTDRGMLYILLGAPDRIQEGPRGEQWLYGMTQLNNTEFSFVRNPHDLNKNDFVLERSIDYHQIWQGAIQKWESGWVKTGDY
ncbi:MAG: GWxTD domain-containing protein [Crocinitomicaceae bacterium]